MCGIAGIINKNNTPVLNSIIEKITKAAAHRGNDDSGFFYEQNFAFGHQRLSIIDVSENGKQPMQYLGRYTITYNGEIYNYTEIKIELKKAGYQFKTQTDTEVIIAAYDYWKANCVKQFNGMWAFAIYDNIENKIFCSRDRFGVKPFYYYSSENIFIFSSEIKQILTVIEAKVNYKTLMDYVVYNLEEHTNETFFDGIRKLPAAHHLIFDVANNQFEIKKYYEPNIDSSLQNVLENDAIEMFQSLMKRSVEWRLRSDVKVGTCLSGGLDSSYITNTASKLYQNNTAKFSAITAQSISNKNDETEFAKQVVDVSNLDWHVTKPNKNDFLQSIDEVIKCQEEPFFNTSNFMQHFVMKAAMQNGIKVLLDGQGGDETLLGYTRYYPAILKSKNILDYPKLLMDAASHSSLSISELIIQSVYFTNPEFRKLRLKKKHEAIKAEYLNLADDTWINKIADSYKNINALQLLELQHTQLPKLLKYEDKNSMHFGVETRLPFLDYQLVEFNLSLPLHLKINNGWSKYILRKAMKGSLPDSIAWRKNKIGFESPENIWLSDVAYFMNTINQSNLLQKIYNNNIPKKLTQHMLWKLFNIAKWEQIFNVKL
ncbi:MAG: hypothetical protein RJA07_2551 [Bacteroidota bacterium]|jgi:asparagine synthase (glutamine-hydrolysing)